MRMSACALALLPALTAGAASAHARAASPGERARPPGPSWSPEAAGGALVRLVTRGLTALPSVEATGLPGCEPAPWAAALDWLGALPSGWLGEVAVAWHGPRCEPGELDVAWQLDLRELGAWDRALATLADQAASDAAWDLTALTASPVPGRESSGFGWRRDPIHHRTKFHKGTDFRAPHGTPVYAAGAGRIVFAGQQRGYGNILYVDHGGGVVTRYAHLSRFETRAGTLVEAGRLIGRVGATGRATGPHLHFEVRLGERAIEPTLAMQLGVAQREHRAVDELVAQLSAAVQEQKIDAHDPPGARKATRKRHRHEPHRGRPDRPGHGRRVRTTS